MVDITGQIGGVQKAGGHMSVDLDNEPSIKPGIMQIGQSPVNVTHSDNNNIQAPPFDIPAMDDEILALNDNPWNSFAPSRRGTAKSTDAEWGDLASPDDPTDADWGKLNSPNVLIENDPDNMPNIPGQNLDEYGFPPLPVLPAEIVDEEIVGGDDQDQMSGIDQHNRDRGSIGQRNQDAGNIAPLVENQGGNRDINAPNQQNPLIGDQNDPAPARTRFRPTEIAIANAEKRVSVDFKKTVGVMATAGAAGGVAVGMTVGGAAGSVVPVIGNLLGAAAGAVVCGVLGAIGGALTGAAVYGLRVLRANMNASRMSQHVKQAMQSLESKGVSFSQADLNRLNRLSPEEWKSMLHVPKKQVPDKQDRQRIREQLILLAAKNTTVDGGTRDVGKAQRYVDANSLVNDALEAKADMIGEAAAGKLHLVRDYQTMCQPDLGGSWDNIPIYIEKHAHTLGSPEMWVNNPMNYTKAPEAIFSQLAAQMLERLGDPNYELTEADINLMTLAETPSRAPNGPSELSQQFEAGDKLTEQQRTQLLDTFAGVYFGNHDNSGALNVPSGTRQEFWADYNNANGYLAKSKLFAEASHDKLPGNMAVSFRNAIAATVNDANVEFVPDEPQLNATRPTPEIHSGVDVGVRFGQQATDAISAKSNEYFRKEANDLGSDNNPYKNDDNTSEVFSKDVARSKMTLNGNVISSNRDDNLHVTEKDASGVWKGAFQNARQNQINDGREPTVRSQDWPMVSAAMNQSIFAQVLESPMFVDGHPMPYMFIGGQGNSSLQFDLKTTDQPGVYKIQARITQDIQLMADCSDVANSNEPPMPVQLTGNNNKASITVNLTLDANNPDNPYKFNRIETSYNVQKAG